MKLPELMCDSVQTQKYPQVCSPDHRITMFSQGMEDYVMPMSFAVAVPRLVAALLIFAAGVGGALAQAQKSSRYSAQNVCLRRRPGHAL